MNKQKESSSENENIQKRFYGAIEFLKKQKINHDTSLYSLPWCFILSTPNADKTEFLLHSQLEFVLKRKNDKPVARHCDWWATKENLFVDINPDYTCTYYSNTRNPLWKDFLKLTSLAKKKPIEALCLFIDLPTLLDAQTHESSGLANAIKHRIKDLRKTLKENFPIYIIITQLDNLHGFVEYFDDLSSEERAQPWGINFESFQTLAPQHLADNFEIEFRELLNRLNGRVIARLHQERNLDRRVKIKDFPLQMESIKKPLASFIESLADMITGKNAALRGIYFISTEPKKISTDRLLQPLTQVFALAEHQPSVQKEAKQDYFTRGLFNEIIMPDIERYYLKDNLEHASFMNKMKWLFAGAVGLATLTFGAYFTHHLITQNRQIALAENFAYQYDYLVKNQKTPSLEQTLIALDNLTKTKIILTQKHFPTLGKLGHSNLDKLPEKADTAYMDVLTKMVYTQITEAINSELKQSGPEANVLYGALKSYLMLGDSEKFNKNYINVWLTQYLTNKNALNLTQISRLKYHLTYFVENYHQNRVLDNDLIIKTRHALQDTKATTLINAILINDTLISPLKIIFPNQNTSTSLFNSQRDSFSVPAIYTASAFEKVYDELIPKTVTELNEGNWVLDTKTHIELAQGNMLTTIRDQYIQDYIHHWDNLLKQMTLAPIHSYKQAIHVARALREPNTELAQLMKIIYENTNISYHNVATPISLYFSTLDNVIYQFKKSSHENLTSIESDLETIMASKTRAITAFEMAKGHALLDEEQGDAFYNLAAFANTAPMPLKQWISSFQKDTWQLILNDAALTINVAWQNTIFKFYKENFAGAYPFQKNAKQEVSIDKFTQFFSRNGIFQDFFSNYLADFLTIDNNVLENKDFFGAKLPITDLGINTLSKINALTEQFFPDKNSDKMQMAFEFAPQHLSKNTKTVELMLDNQTATYSPHYLMPTHFAWPGRNHQNHYAALVFTSYDDRQQTISETGPWAIFRMIARAQQILPKNERTIEADLSMPPFLLGYVIISKAGINPFTPNFLNELVWPDLLS